jgi:hypothetical protein
MHLKKKMTIKYEIPYKSSINTAKYLRRIFDNDLGILSPNAFQVNSAKMSYRIKDKNASKMISKYVLRGIKRFYNQRIIISIVMLRALHFRVFH